MSILCDETNSAYLPVALSSIDELDVRRFGRVVGSGAVPPPAFTSALALTMWTNLSTTGDIEPQPVTWNHLYRQAKYDGIGYAAVFNADDRWRPGGIWALADALDANPDASVAYGDFEMLNEDGTSQGCRKVPQPRQQPIWKAPTPGPFAMFRMSAAAQVELEPGMLFDASYLRCADHHLWVRLWTVGKFVMVDEPVGEFVYRTSSLSHVNPAATQAERRRIWMWGRRYLREQGCA
jgi:hypothetical protein